MGKFPHQFRVFQAGGTVAEEELALPVAGVAATVPQPAPGLAEEVVRPQGPGQFFPREFGAVLLDDGENISGLAKGIGDMQMPGTAAAQDHDAEFVRGLGHAGASSPSVDPLPPLQRGARGDLKGVAWVTVVEIPLHPPLRRGEATAFIGLRGMWITPVVMRGPEARAAPRCRPCPSSGRRRRTWRPSWGIRSGSNHPRSGWNRRCRRSPPRRDPPGAGST